jgi:hypothetical protein
MKKSIIVAFISLVSAFTSNVSASNKLEDKPIVNKIGGSIEIRFGHGAECEKRHGLCFIKVGVSSLTRASISFNDENGELSLSFLESDLKEAQPEVLSYLKGADKFIMPVSYTLTKDVLKLISSKKEITLKEGSYSLKCKSGEYTVIFDNL